MGETTHISWADATFNGWVGCTKVSPACDGCYAEAMMDLRYGRVSWGGPGKGAGTRERTSAANWRKPLAWNKKAAAAGTRPFVFCSSLADVFDNAVPPEWRRDLFELIRATPNLVWLLLTKRPQNIVAMSEAVGGLPPNAALGATCEDQKRADLNVPHLLAAKATLRPAFAFLSCEPLLGPIDLTTIDIGYEAIRNALTGEGRSADRGGELVTRVPPHPEGKLDWIITGGETNQGGHKARPTHPDWFRSLRDQCAAAGVPFHHKQNGEWAACANDTGGWWPVDTPSHVRVSVDGSLSEGGWPMQRVGKVRSGRLLDGITHDARPPVEPVS